MDSAFGLVGKDYVIVVTDCSVVYSILKLKVEIILFWKSLERAFHMFCIMPSGH